MKRKYKLKKEARQFFDKKYHTVIHTGKYWEELNIHENLLDEVEKVYVDYGIRASPIASVISGWSSNEGEPTAEFHFTLKVNDISSKKYEQVSIPELMDEMQKVVNKFFNRYLDSE